MFVGQNGSLLLQALLRLVAAPMRSEVIFPMHLLFSVLFLKLVEGVDVLNQGLDYASQAEICPKKPFTADLLPALRTFLLPIEKVSRGTFITQCGCISRCSGRRICGGTSSHFGDPSGCRSTRDSGGLP